MAINVQLLRVLTAISRFGSVTASAEHLGVTQSTVSHSLDKLRTHYKDPLFVRSGNQLRETALASRLVVEAKRVLVDFDRLETLTETFEPKTSKRAFRIYMNDLAELILLPGLLRRWSDEGFGCALDIVRAPAAEVWQELEAGRIDLVIGTPASAQPSLLRQRLFKEKYVGIASVSHPLRRQLSSLAGYLRCNHCQVKPRGPIHAQLESRLSALAPMRRIRLQVPDLLSVPSLIAGSDLVAAVPSSAVKVFPAREQLHVFELPIENATFDVVQHWHAREHEDPAHRWLRAEVHRSAVRFQGEPYQGAHDSP